jgi:hypothetical protein
VAALKWPGSILSSSNHLAGIAVLFPSTKGRATPKKMQSLFFGCLFGTFGEKEGSVDQLHQAGCQSALLRGAYFKDFPRRPNDYQLRLWTPGCKLKDPETLLKTGALKGKSVLMLGDSIDRNNVAFFCDKVIEVGSYSLVR